MKASDASAQLESIIDTLENAKQGIDDNDTSDFDVESQLNTLAANADTLDDYVSDQ